jgi:hypothetical protein
MLECRHEHDDAARLRCYDAEVDRTLAPRGAALAAAAPAARPPMAAVAAPSAASVVPAAPAAPAAPAPASAAPRTLENLTITALKRRADMGFVAQFDNGDTWEQAPGERGVSVAVGQVVAIRHMELGSYLMIGPHSRWTSRVRRVKQP